MLDELSAEEIVAFVQLVGAVPDNAMVVNENDELTMLLELPAVKSLAEKINEAGDREDVKKYIAENYGTEEENENS